MTRPTGRPSSPRTPTSSASPWAEARDRSRDPGRFAAGSLVRARGREWVVLPGVDDDLLVLRPLGGTRRRGRRHRPRLRGPRRPARDLRAARRRATSATTASARLLRDALRLSVRDGAGPFRCFARIAVEPRPYQLVPLLMALRLDPVRLLDRRRRRHRQDGRGAADRARAARPRRDRAARRPLPAAPRRAVAGGDARQVPHRRRARPAVAPPAASSAACASASRCSTGTRSSSSRLDFIKTDRRRHEFLRTAPELVIVDEAHTCVEAGGGRRRAPPARTTSCAGLAERRRRAT